MAPVHPRLCPTEPVRCSQYGRPVIFALEFSDNVDPTALATVLLALLTFATVVVGGLALRRTRSEIDLSRREVEEAHRPVLIPVFDENLELREVDAPTVYRAKPRYKENNRIVVPIKNIGMGPALNITVWIAPTDPFQPQDRDELSWHVSPRVQGLGAMEMYTAVVVVTGLRSCRALSWTSGTTTSRRSTGQRARTTPAEKAVGTRRYGSRRASRGRPHRAAPDDGALLADAHLTHTLAPTSGDRSVETISRSLVFAALSDAVVTRCDQLRLSYKQEVTGPRLAAFVCATP